MTISFAPEINDQELQLAELSAISGGVVPALVLVGIGAAVIWGGKILLCAVEKDNVAQNLDSNCGGGDSDCSGSNRLSYGGLTEKAEDPFGGAFAGKR